MIKYYVIRIKLGRLKLKNVPEQYRAEVVKALDLPCEEIEEKIVKELEEQIVEEIEEVTVEEIPKEIIKLTINDVEEISSKFGFKVSQNVNYIAIKKGRFNFATIDNNITSITIKNGNTFSITSKDELENIMKTHLAAN